MRTADGTAEVRLIINALLNPKTLDIQYPGAQVPR
jgi:hypothetical protein